MNENETITQHCKLPHWVIAILIASLLLNVVTYARVGSLRQEIRNIQNNISVLNGSINNSVSSSIYQMNDALKKEASIVTEFKYEFGEYKDKRINILLNIKPKTFTEGDKLYFSYNISNEIPILIEAQSTDNINFEAQINMSIFDNMDLDFIIDSGTSRKTEKLESIYRPAEQLAARLDAHPLGGTMTYDNKKSSMVISYGFELFYNRSGMNEYTLSDVEISILVNGKEVGSEPIPQIDNSRYNLQLTNYKIPCKTDDEVDIYIMAKDDKGFNYRCLAAKWKIGRGSSVEHADYMGEIGRVQIE